MSDPQLPRALSAVLPKLRCSICTEALMSKGISVVCAAGHSFDVSRQGYLNLAVGPAAGGTGDTAAMVQARQQFLGGGHYRPVADEVAAAVVGADFIADLGGGTGYYLAAALAAAPQATGVCLDRSAAALRRAARAHPRAAAVGCNVWNVVPLADGCTDVLLNIFAPRNADEIRRVLAPGGRVVVVTPTPRHLAEIIEPLGMLAVDRDKASRLAVDLHGLRPSPPRNIEYAIDLDHGQLIDLVLMGPAAHHVTRDELTDRVGQLPDVTQVTVSVDLTIFAHEAQSGQVEHHGDVG